MRRALIPLALLAPLAFASAASAAAGVVAEFPLSKAGSVPNAIVVGADGNLWFAESAANRIGRITPGGGLREFTVPQAASAPVAVTLGSDQNVWFTENKANRIGRITPTGALKAFVVPTANSHPFAIATGPDGNVWFTEGLGKIGRITPAGAIIEYPLAPNSRPAGIISGADGDLWFTELGTNKIGRITPTGAVHLFTLPNPTSEPTSITAGPDGGVWFLEQGVTKRIGRITHGGSVTEYPLPLTGQPGYLATGIDGDLWIAANGNNELFRVTTTGAVTTFSVPTGGGHPYGITSGPDGRIWFTEAGASKIGVASTGVDLNPTAPSLAGPGAVAQPLLCGPGVWSASPVLSEQWLRDGAPLGVRGALYTPAATDLHHAISCLVTAVYPGIRSSYQRSSSPDLIGLAPIGSRLVILTPARLMTARAGHTMRFLYAATFSCRVTVTITLRRRVIATLHQNARAGADRVAWSAKVHRHPVAAGVYIVTFTADGAGQAASTTMRLILTK